MSEPSFPELTCRYSRLSRLGFGVVFLIFAYGGVGMVFGLVHVEPDERMQQVLIGLLFLAIAAGFGLAGFEMYRAGIETILSIGAEGLWDRRLTQGPLPWSEIEIVKGPDPGFLERLVIPGKTRGSIIIGLKPGVMEGNDFIWSWSGLYNRMRYPRRGKLQIFHRTLDASHATISTALAIAVATERTGDGPPPDSIIYPGL